MPTVENGMADNAVFHAPVAHPMMHENRSRRRPG